MLANKTAKSCLLKAWLHHENPVFIFFLAYKNLSFLWHTLYWLSKSQNFHSKSLVWTQFFWYRLLLKSGLDNGYHFANHPFTNSNNCYTLISKSNNKNIEKAFILIDKHVYAVLALQLWCSSTYVAAPKQCIVAGKKASSWLCYFRCASEFSGSIKVKISR